MHSLTARAVLIIAHLFTATYSVVLQSLSSPSASWTVRNFNGSIALPATVPGVIHLDLLSAGMIGEPYAGLNVDSQAWVKNEAAWVWSCNFVPSAALLASPRVELVAEGVDSVATISLNGNALWAQDDAFVRTVVDVGGLLRGGGVGNTLTVAVSSSTLTALSRSATCSGFCPSPAWGTKNLSAYDQAGNYVRKPGVNFGWDFAPNFSPTGVWRDIFLRGYVFAALEDVSVETAPVSTPVPLGGGGSEWALSVTAYLAVAAPCNVAVTLAVAGLPGAAGSARAAVGAAGGAPVEVRVVVPLAQAWWPAGLGDPRTYNASVALAVEGAPGDAALLPFPLAFRAVALRQPPVGAPGGNSSLFFFEVNGHALFVKGANWVPVDAFSPRAAARAQLAPKIAAFSAAGYNALRVWGGGAPQPDVFYELAQEAGLLLWHEMPYACMGFPTGGSALDNAAREAAAIVRRLQKYSVLLWGGNNEVAQIQHYAPSSAGSGNYSALFFGALGGAVAAVDPTRRYVPTSPGSGAETAAAPVAFPAMTPRAGDMHVYVYDGDCLDPTRYPRARAASEFGWQSYAAFVSLAELIAPAHFDFWSPPVQRRDTHGSQPPATILFHNVGMNWRIPGYNGTSPSAAGARDARLAGAALTAAAAARTAGATSTAYTARSDGSFALPTDALGIVPMMSAYGGVGAATGTVFRDTLFLTQVSHAACLKTEAEAYRRGQSLVDEEGGGTSTLLYWMAADLWPAATKGSIEWSGRWKAAHYEAARGFLAPLLVSPWSVPINHTTPPAAAPFGVTLAAHPPASLRGALPRGLLRVACWSWAQGALGAADTPFSIPAWPAAWGPVDATGAAGGAVELLKGASLADALASCGCGPPRAPAECVIAADVFNASTADPAARVASNWLHPVPLNQVSTMREPGLAVVAVEARGGGAFDVTLTARALPVANVWVESLLCCGWFSDNNFLMLESPRVLRYTPGADARGWAHAPPPGAERNVSAGQFAASLSVWSLWDTVSGYGGGVLK